MKSLWIPIGVLVAVVIAGAVLVALPGKSSAPTTQPTTIDLHADLIVANTPVLGPTSLTLSGKARGTWYFEASFPVELRDAQGKVLAQVPAQAQGEWMTQEFVPFSATLTFAKQPAGSKGTLILHKDNPSGDPAREDSITLPIVFQ